jgi:hypothetical protein
MRGCGTAMSACLSPSPQGHMTGQSGGEVQMNAALSTFIARAPLTVQPAPIMTILAQAQSQSTHWGIRPLLSTTCIRSAAALAANTAVLRQLAEMIFATLGLDSDVYRRPADRSAFQRPGPYLIYSNPHAFDSLA